MMSERDAEGKPTTILSITAQVDFFSSNPFEGQIKSKTMSTMLEVLGCWCKLAHEALRLTQQRAEERKKRQELEEQLRLAQQRPVTSQTASNTSLGKRIALVMGNANYKVRSLKNAKKPWVLRGQACNG
jgi:hypothetical protein